MPSSEQADGVRGPSRRVRRSMRAPGGPLDQVVRWIDQHADGGALAGLGLVILGSALALGSVHRSVILAVSATAAAATLVATRSGAWRLSPFSGLALALALYSWIQSLPLPLTWLSYLSPSVARVWQEVLVPFNEPPLKWGSLSLDPGASRVEALKWVTYALVASLAATVEKRGTRSSVPLIVVISGVVIAVATLGHWLVGAEAVYGVFRPHSGGIIAPFINANNLAGYLNLAFFCGLACLLDRESVAPRWLLGTFAACVMAVSALQVSRGGLMSLAVGLLLFSVGMVARYTRARREMQRGDGVLVIASTILGGFGLLWMSMAPGTFERLLAEGTEKIDLLSWTPALIRDNPWFGVGRGAFETAFPPYRGGRGHLIYGHAENFVLQWTAEWGIPVTLATLLALGWMLRPSRSRLGERSASAAVGLAIGVLLLHNLVDLALEVPAVGIAVAALVGGLSVGRKQQPQEGLNRLQRLAPSLAGVAFLGAFSTAAVAGASAETDRMGLHASYQGLVWSDPAEVSRFKGRLREAMVSHPGDAYLPLLGGLAARRGKWGVPMTWASQALERDPRGSRTHLFIAELLHARGATAQAFLHLRYAADYDPAASELAARYAIAWSKDEAQLVRAVPEGAAGAQSLVHMAHQVPGTRYAPLRVAILTAAVARDPNNYTARELRAWQLVGDLVDASGKLAPDAKARVRVIEQDALAMRRLVPSKSGSVEVRALMLAALSRAEEGLSLLEEGCGATSALSCYSRWLEVASKVPNERRLDRAATAFLTASCVGVQGCAEGEMQVAAAFAGKGRWGRALRHYEAAAKVQPSTDAWLRVAEAAQQISANHVAARALRHAAREAEASDPRRKKEIEAKYQALMGEVMPEH